MSPPYTHTHTRTHGLAINVLSVSILQRAQASTWLENKHRDAMPMTPLHGKSLQPGLCCRHCGCPVLTSPDHALSSSTSRFLLSPRGFPQPRLSWRYEPLGRACLDAVCIWCYVHASRARREKSLSVSAGSAILSIRSTHCHTRSSDAACFIVRPRLAQYGWAAHSTGWRD